MEKRKIIPALLVLCVIFAIVPRPGAAAAGMSGLEVIGQTAMTQQIFTDLSVIGADSCGLTDAINSSKNPAQTIGEWIKGYWDSWLLRQQLTWGTVLNIAAAGARYTGNGDLLFNSQLSDLFTRFYNWLWDGEAGPQLKDEVVAGGGGGDRNNLYHPDYVYNLHISELPIRVKYSINGAITDNNYTVLSSSAPVYGGIYAYESDNIRFFAFSSAPFRYDASQGSSFTATSFYGKDGELLYYIHGFYGAQSTKVHLIEANVGVTTVTDNGNLQALSKEILWDIAYQIIYGIGDDMVVDPGRLGGLTGADTNVVAPPDVINWPDFGGNGGYIDVNDYITGVRGAIESEDGTADVNITDAEGVESTQTMEIDQTTDIPVESEITAEMVNQGEVISTATPSTEIADYTIDLRNYFPFCIPWDLYDMVTLLVADPVAPHVQYPFVIEPLNVNYTIDLDFSEFDSVATVLRTMELLAAGIGLALMTKRLIQGGD